MLILLGFKANAQGTISGVVKDAETGEFVIGAYITSGAETVATDFMGNYSITIPSGVHELSCSFIGMGKQTKQFDVRDGDKLVWDITLSAESKVLDIAVVSAGRFEQKFEEVTVSLEVLQPALVENKATTSLESAIEQTPGVSLVDGEPQIRSGSGFSYGAGSRVMVMVDDLPVLSGDAGRPTWGFLPLENLEQVEIIKGASSVLYGSAALSGVINIRTRYPDARPLTRVSLQHGLYSNPRTSEAIYWDTPLQQSNVRFLHSQQIGGWDVVIGGNFLGDDGHKGPEIVSYTDSISGNIIGVDTLQGSYNPLSVDRYAANVRGRVNVNIRRRKSKIEGLTYGLSTNWQMGESLNTLIWDDNNSGIYSSYDGGTTRTNQLVGTVDPFIEYLSPSGVRTSFRNRWQHLVNNNDNNQSNSSDVFYSEVQTQKLGAFGMEKTALTAGAVHQYTISNAELYMGGDTTGINTARNIAAYLQLDQPISEQLNLSMGLRYEHFDINGTKEGKPVFRAGANYQLAEETYLRASMGQGFRFPTIAEKYIRTGLGQLQVYPNNDLRPETSTSIELGVKQGFKVGQFGGYLDFALFRQHYNDFIEFTFAKWVEPDPPPGEPGAGLNNLNGRGFRSVNTGESLVTGAEISVMGQAEIGEKTISLLAGYTYTNPISVTPDFDYNTEGNDYADSTITFSNTSSDPTNNILKYRSQHLVRFDMEVSNDIGFLGLSARYQSALQNIDVAFLDLERYGAVDWGLMEWLSANHSDENGWGYYDWSIADNAAVDAGFTDEIDEIIIDGEEVDYIDFIRNVDEAWSNDPLYKLPWIIDMRLGFNVNDNSKVSLVISNLLNEEYAIRPLAVNSPRLFNVVYTYEIK